MIKLISKKLPIIPTQLIFVVSNNNSTSNIQLLDGKVPKILINKPKTLNSLNLQMVKDMAKLIPKVEQFPTFWVEGVGGRAFCAGGDVKTLFEGDTSLASREEFFREEFSLDYRLATSKSIEIVNWDGIVMGGGLGISHFAPFRIATQNTQLAMPETKIGFFTDVGCGSTLASLRNNIGMYIALTSGRLKGEEVYNTGFANYFVNKENIQKIYEQINAQVGDRQHAKSIIEGVLKKYHKGDPNKKFENQQQISYIFSGETVKQIYQRAKASKTPFGESAVKALQGVCPLSVHITHKLVKQSKNLNKRQLYKRDFILAQHMISNKNFQHGVKSLLILKDNNPKWTHSNLLDVSQEEVNAIFTQIVGRKPLQI